MLCANLEGASLVSCNFDDPAGSAANMEGVNLKEATLEGSNMARVNLRQSCKKMFQTLDTTCNALLYREFRDTGLVEPIEPLIFGSISF